ncbi:uncharacterized protein MELLADRAFT_95257 [Melampsora larici-populina 98AG31]|uniref:tRNA-splicing endonuclease subunit Sen34 n=1 Tax=Melampsora larici-populina (strain 98AG31 / pathotype 3-4-7) TaxID=747676 RepID=F4RCT1_MELLP|nr:uncharacterized protein MELLADRAFT_95257 [Melampsora larici-populina 98AG31]EGG09932.1 hypothetical protein MELLADRAFT_95257 [Melampsora larici-populina 98AG31]
MQIGFSGFRYVTHCTHNQPIPITVSNGKGYIWNIDDIAQLRVDHHICGMLTGTLPQLAQKNVFLGLRLQLLPEEVVLLVELGISVLVDERNNHRRPTLEESKTYQQKRDVELYKEHQEVIKLEAKRRSEMEALYSEDIARAATLRKARNVTKSSDQHELFNPEADVESNPKPQKETKVDLNKVNYYIPVPLKSNSPCYEPSESTFTDLRSAREVGLWTYPNTNHQRAHCEVFKALWKEGMYMGISFKFCCDFLVYPGDALRFHLHFACTVIESPSTSINPIDLVAFGRLATAVKKVHLLACWDSETGSIDYLSLEWAGMG